MLPTGAERISQYLRPLAALPELAPHIRLESRIIGITRSGYDKMNELRTGADVPLRP